MTEKKRGVQGRETLFGFRVTGERESRELGGRGVYLLHEATGARLFWLDNGAENKTFSIGFRTLPEDDTGVFHILEHSVLCGSRRYPVREPFVELLKGSMSTFLNAMTFPDMTLYPVSSRNDRDLLNLVQVYLDAVFAPRCLEDENIFRQEGWHIDTDGEGRPEYRGVVLGEMKGAMSDVDNLMERQIAKQLFPDTSYGFHSGGDPEHIPDLTFEEFRRQYRRHYHPSNAWVYLDGSVPVEQLLPLLESYFSRYPRLETLPQFAWQAPVASEETIYYELGPDESPENRSHYTRARICGAWRDVAENEARAIVCDVLAGTNEAPLKRAILEKGLAEDFSLTIDETGLQSFITLHADNVTDGQEAAIDAVVREVGETVARTGIDHEAAEATLNRMIFAFREEEEPQGIGRCIRAMGGWIFGGDPLDELESEALLKQLRGMISDGRLDALAADMLLNREHMAVLHTRPSRTVGEERRARESRRLQAITSGWTPEERRRNETLCRELNRWQAEPDSPEALATLPRLTRKDADVSFPWVETQDTAVRGARVLAHRVNCGGVTHVRASFLLTDCTLDQVPVMASAASLLGRLPTRDKDAWTLQQQLKRYTGRFGVTVSHYSRAEEREYCTPCVTAYISALNENLPQALALLAEVLTRTRFDATDRITEYIRQAELNTRQKVLSAGHLIATCRVMSGYSAEGALRETLDGATGVALVHRLAADPDKAAELLRGGARRLAETTVCRKRAVVTVVSDGPVDLGPLLDALPEGTPAPDRAAYALPAPPATGFAVPAQVGFSAQGYSLNELGLRFRGPMWLAAGILSLNYLWNQVRVQGGAYGAGLSIDRAGNVTTFSFRDPTPGRSLEVNKGLARAIRAFVDSGEELDRYIISALNELNPLLSPRDKGMLASMWYLTGYTREMAEETRKRVLNATAQELADCASWLEALAEKGRVCVVGPREMLESCLGLEIETL